MAGQLTLTGEPLPPPGANSDRFRLEPVHSACWPRWIEALARAMGRLSLPTELVFRRAWEGVGHELCQRRTRCILAMGVDIRFLYTPPTAEGLTGLWRVRQLPPPVVWRWSQGWRRWYIVGLEQEAARACEQEVYELAEASDRMQMALGERKKS